MLGTIRPMTEEERDRARVRSLTNKTQDEKGKS